VSSALENLFAMQLDSAGLTGYVREYQAIPGRKFRFDFAFIEPHRLLIEINGGTYNGGAHGRGVGINRDYEKGNLAVQHGFRLLQFDTKMVKSGVGLETTERVLRGEK
jgi:very-short-patch-repair endonuclease